jgi:hypothetical protein
VPMLGTIDRDLASTELWERSLERSRRRRVLADDARKEIARRKTTTFALTAAVAAAPMSPSIGAVANLSKGHVDKKARSLDRQHIERILLTYGDRGSSVAQLQQALHIPADGIFGPQTRAAIRAFQDQADLPVTGEVNVRTWLTLFPTDMIVYAPPGTSSALGVDHAHGPQWAAVANPHAQLASTGDHGSASHHQAHAAALFGGGQAATQGDVPDGVSTPPVGNAPKGGGFPNGGVPKGGGNSVGGGPAPAPPSFHFPQGGTVGDMISAMMSAARQIDRRHYAYSWGGGHNSSFSGPYDCSGAVSAVLHAAGLLSSPRVSGGFMHWGAPGPGAVTIYANAGHVYMSILGHYFGTSSSNPGGGAGWFNGGPRPGFAVVHVPFSKLHLRRHRRHHRHHRRHRRHATTQQPQSGSQPTTQQQAPPDNTAPKQTTTSQSTTKSGTTDQQQPSSTQSSGTQTAVSQPVQQAQTTQPAPAPAPQPTSAPVASGQTQAQGPVTQTTQPAAPQAAPAPAPQVSAPTTPAQSATPAGPPANAPVSPPQTPSRGYAPGQQGAAASAGAPGKTVSAEAQAGHPATPVKAGQQNKK